MQRLQPLNPYGQSKHRFDLEVLRRVNAGEKTPPFWAGLKFFNVYGPNEYHKGRMISVVKVKHDEVVSGQPARLFRSGVLQVKAQEYIEAARAAGCSNSRIILRHILPNAIQPIIVSISFGIGAAILQESVFSFLGVGFQPPTPAWGIMVGESRDYITSAPHLFFFPAGALVLTVLAFTFIGDGMRDALDPKLRGAT